MGLTNEEVQLNLDKEGSLDHIQEHRQKCLMNHEELDCTAGSKKQYNAEIKENWLDLELEEEDNIQSEFSPKYLPEYLQNSTEIHKQEKQTEILKEIPSNGQGGENFEEQEHNLEKHKSEKSESPQENVPYVDSAVLIEELSDNFEEKQKREKSESPQENLHSVDKVVLIEEISSGEQEENFEDQHNLEKHKCEKPESPQENSPDVDKFMFVEEISSDEQENEKSSTIEKPKKFESIEEKPQEFAKEQELRASEPYEIFSDELMENCERNDMKRKICSDPTEHLQKRFRIDSPKLLSAEEIASSQSEEENCLKTANSEKLEIVEENPHSQESTGVVQYKVQQEERGQEANAEEGVEGLKLVAGPETEGNVELDNKTEEPSQDTMECEKSEIKETFNNTQAGENSVESVESVETVQQQNNEPTSSNSQNPTNTEDDEDNFEKSASNPELIQKILGDQMPAQWDPVSHQPYLLKTVAANTDEYKRIYDIFAKTANGRKIQKLERVENPYLLAHFIRKKEEMSKNDAFVEEKLLYHGTREGYVDGICKNNFDWRRCGSSRGHKFGQGVSFSPLVTFARHFTPDNILILTKVLVSKCKVGDYDTVIPPPPYDTTKNKPGTVFVKYEDDDFFPQYVIHFKSGYTHTVIDWDDSD